MRSQRKRALSVTLVLVLSALGIAHQVGAGTDLLFLAPVLLAFWPLLAGRYLGEERLERLARTLGARERRSWNSGSGPPQRARRGPAMLLPRGGGLLAAHLAVRPPPPVVGVIA